MPTRRLILIAMTLCLTLITSLTATAQVGTRYLGTTVSAASINTLASAHHFHPNQQITVTNVENATIEAGEVVHSCLASPSAGNYSIWFVTNLTPGTLTIDTSGTSYGNFGISSDTVVSIYRVATTSVQYAGLVGVSCEDDGASSALISNLPVVGGTYLIQVSAPTTVTAGAGSTVVLTANFAPAAPTSNDNLAKAKPLTFPNHYTQWNIENATLETNELTSPGDTTFGTHSVWYKFTLATQGYVAFQNFYAHSGNQAFDLFKAATASGVTTYTYIAGSTDILTALLTPGKYVLRVGLNNTPAGYIGNGQYSFLSTLYTIPVNYEFSTGSYVDSGIGSITGWKVTKANTGATPDEVVCVSAQCYFQFSSNGATEATSISTTFPMPAMKIKAGDGLVMMGSFTYNGPTNSDLLVTYQFFDAAGKSVKLSTRMRGTIGLHTTKVFPAAINANKVKITIKNMDKSGVGVTRLNNIISVIIRLGSTSTARDIPLLQPQSQVLPLPPAP